MSAPRPDPHTELAERARLLAKRRTERRAEERALAVFERTGERYAIEPRYVFEVARAPAPTPLPRSAAHWLGLTSLHGELMAVAELPVLLGNELSARVSSAQEDEASAPSLLLLVLGIDAPELALAIDRLHKPVSMEGEFLQTPHTDTGNGLVAGVTEDGLRVVHGESLLSDPRLLVESTEPHPS